MSVVRISYDRLIEFARQRYKQEITYDVIKRARKDIIEHYKKIYKDSLIVVGNKMSLELDQDVMEEIQKRILDFYLQWTRVFGETKISKILARIIRKSVSGGARSIKSLVPPAGSKSKNPNTAWVRTGLTKKAVDSKAMRLYISGLVLGLIGLDKKYSTDEVLLRYDRGRFKQIKKIFRYKVRPTAIGFTPKWKPKLFQKAASGKVFLRKFQSKWSGLLVKELVRVQKKFIKKKTYYAVKRKHIPSKIWHLIDRGFYNVMAKKRFEGYGYTAKGFRFRPQEVLNNLKIELQKEQSKLIKSLSAKVQKEKR